VEVTSKFPLPLGTTLLVNRDGVGGMEVWRWEYDPATDAIYQIYIERRFRRRGGRSRIKRVIATREGHDVGVVELEEGSFAVVDMGRLWSGHAVVLGVCPDEVLAHTKLDMVERS
jgi:hypothetical protein